MEQQVQGQTNEILSMLGPEGVFAILGTIFVLRTIRTFRYWEKWQMFTMNIGVGGLIGAGSTYFVIADTTARQIGSGAFLCVIGSMIAYEFSRMALGYLYEKTEMEIWRVFYFFLSPAPMKYKDRGLKTEAPPHPSLTQFFDRARVDR